MLVRRYERIKMAHDEEGPIFQNSDDEEDSHKRYVNEDGCKLAFTTV